MSCVVAKPELDLALEDAKVHKLMGEMSMHQDPMKASSGIRD